jgi:hypothetical protein
MRRAQALGGSNPSASVSNLDHVENAVHAGVLRHGGGRLCFACLGGSLPRRIARPAIQGILQVRDPLLPDELEALRAAGLPAAAARWLAPRCSQYLDCWIRPCAWYADRSARLFSRRCGRLEPSAELLALQWAAGPPNAP